MCATFETGFSLEKSCTFGTFEPEKKQECLYAGREGQGNVAQM
jgi:hypothetical protein